VSVATFIGMGANLGDRLDTLAAALKAMDELPETMVLAVSRVYETEPWGAPDQPPYANAVAELRTSLSAPALLDALHDIEDSLGRVRTERYGARTIDLDILLFGDEEWQSEHLTIPHPRLLEREFTVRPLLEVAPDVTLPDGEAVTATGAVHGRITGVLGALPGWEDRTVLPGIPHGSSDHVVVADGQEWVEVASSSLTHRMDRAPDFEMLFLQTVFEEEGIPYVFDPYAPTENYNPWGLTRPTRLLVPAPYAERAGRLVADVRRHPPVEPSE